MYTSLPADVAIILDRDLGVMAAEVAATPEADLWRILPGINNSVGNLCLHLCGNLRHFIGAVLGEDAYIRNIEGEFNQRNIPREALLAEIETTRLAVGTALAGLDPARLVEPMPKVPPHHQGRSVGFFLIQLCCHFSRHEGQMNYLRRLLAGQAT
jgi:hypothetical protein